MKHTQKNMEEYNKHGVRYKAKNGMIYEIHTQQGWIDVWNTNGPSRAVRALLDKVNPGVVRALAIQRGDKIT